MRRAEVRHSAPPLPPRDESEFTIDEELNLAMRGSDGRKSFKRSVSSERPWVLGSRRTCRLLVRAACPRRALLGKVLPTPIRWLAWECGNAPYTGT